MGLWETLTDAWNASSKVARRAAEPIRSKDHFKELYLDGLLNSKELRGYFFDGKKPRDDAESKHMQSELLRMVDANYDKYGPKQYEDKGIFRRFIASPLRKIGAAAAALSHWYLNVYYSSEAYAITMAPALLMMGAADAIDALSYIYHNHEGYDFIQLPKIVLEGIVEKGLAVVPGFVTPAFEATMGQTKFDRAVASKILYRTKNEFVKKFGEYQVPDTNYQPAVYQFPRSIDEVVQRKNVA